MVILISLGLKNDTKKAQFNQCVGNCMIYSNFHMLPTVCTSMLNADGQLYVYILCVFLLTMPG